MFLFILESIGTAELILIAVVALIVFGPRKLPGMAKTIGKTMAEFRKATNEFKTTWEKEANLEKEVKEMGLLTDTIPVTSINEEKISSQSSGTSPLAPPKVKELSEEEIRQIFPSKNDISELPTSEIKEETQSAKRNWL